MAVNEDLERIAWQEKELRLPRFDAQTAWELGTRLRTMAEQRGHVVVIDVRRMGQSLFYTAFEGATPDNGEWVRRKNNVLARFHRSSYAVGLNLRSKGMTLLDRYGLAVADYACDGGAFPIAVVNAGVVGSATVSGLAQRADHELVVEALCGLLGRDYAEVKLADESS